MRTIIEHDNVVTSINKELSDYRRNLRNIEEIKEGTIKKATVDLCAVFEFVLKNVKVPEGLSLETKTSMYSCGYEVAIQRDEACCWDGKFSWEVAYGGDEGIYLDFYYDVQVESFKKERYYLGCAKTCYRDDESFRQMSALAAEYALALYTFSDLL